MPSIKKLLQAAAGNAGGAESDPDFNQVSLLLNGDGTDGGQNNTYTDSSTNSLTLTKNGEVTQGSISPFGDNWSVYVSGVDTQGFTTSTSSWGDFGTGDFSIEAWVYPEALHSTGGFRVFDTRASAAVAPWMFGVRSSSNPFIDFMYGSDARITGSISISLNEWTHIAVTRESGTVRLFVNGVLDTSATITSSINCGTSTPRILKLIDSGSSPKGYASNIRVVKGTAVYTSAFTPPTEPLTAVTNTSLLICQSNYFVDNSTNAYTLTVSGTPKVTSFSPFVNSEAITLADNGGSAYLDGFSDYIASESSADLGFGTGDWTIECWIYPTGTNSGMRVWSMAQGDNADINIGSTGTLNYFNGVSSTTSAAGIVNQYQWSHIAMVRSSGTVSGYANGVQVLSQSTTPNTTARSIYIGGNTDQEFLGYISNFRVVKGTAVYTSSFTPPTAPLTAITNTALLLNFKDAAIFDYAALSNLGTIGNADISTAVVKYGTGSLAFDGTGDYLSTVYNPILNFDTGDFTVECWVYVTGNGTGGTTYQAIFGSNSNAPPSYWNVYRDTRDDTLVFFGNDNVVRPTSNTITSNSWVHIAFSRASGTLKGFINGVEGYSATVTTSYTTNPSGFRVGFDHGASTAYFQGYIDDLRITKGLARYTSAFTPPEAALPTF
jgi:hypothetical protein